MLNVAALLEDSARRFPNRLAVVTRDDRLTYFDVDRKANQVAHVLIASGLRAGDKVALSCPNSAHFPIAYFGILKAGCVVVPLNILLTAREIAYHLRDSEAKAYFCYEDLTDDLQPPAGRTAFDEVESCEHLFTLSARPRSNRSATVQEWAEDLDDVSERQPDTFETRDRSENDTAVIVYTSGTTGYPKGAELTHANLVLNAVADNRAYGPGRGEREIQLVALPLFHSFGASAQMNAGFATASTLVLVSRFDADDVLSVMDAEEVTLFAGVPTMYVELIDRAAVHPVGARSLKRLRTALSGGAALPVHLLERFRSEFGLPIVEGYGLTETSPGCLLTDPDCELRPGSVGVPMWGVEVRLVDEQGNVVQGPDQVGEVVVRGHNVMKGYYRRPEETAATIRGGWLHTGDLAKRDELGNYYIVDRLKDMIIRGGFNVYPREIEEVLSRHPDVAQAAVIGEVHPRHGEEIVAFVVPRRGRAIDAEELITWSRGELAAYKYPRQVHIVDSMPTTATGKILKRALR